MLEIPFLEFEPIRVVPRQSTGYVHSDDELVVAALRYMSAQAHTPIGVGDVACKVLVSRRTLERRFCDSLGRSVAAEIRRLRVARAKHFLRDTELPLTVVAHQSGFRNAQSLCEVFQREEGITPTRFRRGNASSHDIPERLSPKAAAKRATVNGKYSGLMRTITVEHDYLSYSAFCDYGFSRDSSYGGQHGIPDGYWVYVYPNWYAFQNATE